MSDCVDCFYQRPNGEANKGRIALLTHALSHNVCDFVLCEACFNGIGISNSGWAKKEWKSPIVIDTLKNPREAVMF